jgi:hypothetical protein
MPDFFGAGTYVHHGSEIGSNRGVILPWRDPVRVAAAIRPVAQPFRYDWFDKKFL